MPRINSANPDFPIVDVDSPNAKANYSHGLGQRKSFIPVAFQVTSPFDSRRVLMPHALVMHVNPQTWNPSYTQRIERIQTRGGFVEQHWGEELTDLSADGSTGAFMNIYTGLTSVLRQRTIAWDRYRDLYDLYHNNGSLHDPFGNVVLQGNIMLMFDRGVYLGYFKTFEVEETDDQPFAFRVSWSFKIEEELLKIPNLIQDPSQRGTFNAGGAPAFQGQNRIAQDPTATSQAANNPPTTLAASQAAAVQADQNAQLAQSAAAAAKKSPQQQQADAAFAAAAGNPFAPAGTGVPSRSAPQSGIPTKTQPTPPPNSLTNAIRGSVNGRG